MRRQGVGCTSLRETLDTTTPGGWLVFHVFAALAGYIRELIVSGTREGLAPAPATAPHDRHPRDHPRRTRHAPNPGASTTSIARLLGVSPGILYNDIPDLCELRPRPGTAAPGRGLLDRGRFGLVAEFSPTPPLRVPHSLNKITKTADPFAC